MPEPRIPLDQWRALVAVVEKGGYAKAAAALHKSQSSVTYGVQQLESQLGVKAFKIAGRRAELTPTGELLYRRARYLLDLAAARVPRSPGQGEPAHAHRADRSGARAPHRCPRAGPGRPRHLRQRSARLPRRAADAAALRPRRASRASCAPARPQALAARPAALSAPGGARVKPRARQRPFDGDNAALDVQPSRHLDRGGPLGLWICMAAGRKDPAGAGGRHAEAASHARGRRALRRALPDLRGPGARRPRDAAAGGDHPRGGGERMQAFRLAPENVRAETHQLEFQAARVVKLVDTGDLKSPDLNRSCRFESGPGHQFRDSKH